ncbi:serine/threonine protein phosphatase [Akkermansiaceae bacterium]|nr:serine/threonine protein phosphatase [Akkermansiaceae bacterium]MDB4510001.1 serine/threonine protein phosphatase [Akkermansiaceae bacterium]MDB4572641.1 serine/threonine protein phosphatase [Akkermansiaceae bacterium]MDB4680837.1 serine/threonine protein phosphatase [Akkermansiaceae bacterium]MDF1711603.1 metallophosphoesterase family protein [Akkermansiaceae bacterium]
MGRQLAIGDIHGCLNSLKTLLEFVQPVADDKVIMLGDYVDRGPDSKGVIDYLLDWPWEAKLVLLKGNHEIIMDEAGFSAEHLNYWCQVGGLETIASYDARFANIPDSHWEFIRNTLPYYETEQVIYVHGGVGPKKPLVKQDPVNLAWRRFPDAKEHRSGKLVVCGHTIQRKGKPTDKGHTVCIDTAACRGGWLTCFNAKTGRYWQANERGQTRKKKLKAWKKKKARALEVTTSSSSPKS